MVATDTANERVCTESDRFVAELTSEHPLPPTTFCHHVLTQSGLVEPAAAVLGRAKYMVEDSNPASPKSVLSTLGDLGPKWITSIAGFIVALTGAGFFVGHATATQVATPQPTITIIKTVLAQATTTATSSSSASPGATGTTGATAAPGVANAANGTQLGAYTIDLSWGYSVPLTTAKPGQAQFTTTDVGDVNLGNYAISPLNGDKVVTLPGGTKPSYQACSNASTFVNGLGVTAGASGCVVEASGKLAGVYVDSQQSTGLVLDVTVWQYTH